MSGVERNLRLVLSYDGTRFLGWQWQPYGPTIQGELQEAVRKLTGETVDVAGSGRTDAGVHAIGQVANFVTTSALPAKQFLPGLNHYLPDEIIVRKVDEVPQEFHAQFRAKRKRYRYVMSDVPLTLPFLKPYLWSFRSPLDVKAMHEAGQVLVGKHDFRCFESKWPNKATSVRTIMELTVSRHADWQCWGETPATDPDFAAPFVSLEVVADGFLWNMVRAITGTLVKVGQKKWTREYVQRILETGDRRMAGETAPARGLYLVSVDYE